MNEQDPEAPTTTQKVLRTPRTRQPGFPPTRALSPGRLALLQLIVKFPGVLRQKLLSIPGVSEADLDYLTSNQLIQVREPARLRATRQGTLVGLRGW